MLVGFFILAGLLIAALTQIARVRNLVESNIEEQRRILNWLERIKEDVREFQRKAPPSEKEEPAPVAQPVFAPKPPVFVSKPPPLPAEAQTEAEIEPEPEVERPVSSSVLPSAFAETAGEILGKIWHWILFGAESKPTGVSTEYVVATTWLPRLGIVVVVACAGYFLKWTIERGLLSNEARVAIAIAFGLAMLAWGMKLLRGKYQIIGQGLMGGGVVILYFSVYSAVAMYRLIGPSLAFPLLVLLTVAAGIVSVRTDSLLVAILGIAGGFVTPVLLSTGESRFMVLYSYMLLLGLGALGISHYKQWRLLNYLCFFFTYAIFIGSLGQYRTEDFPVAIVFLSLFFVVQSSLVYLYNIARRKKTTVLEIVHLVLNASVYATLAYDLIVDAHGRPCPALMSLALAIFYILHVFAFIRNKLVDRGLLLTLVALAGFFTTWTMPLAMEKESITICWALQALLFLWLGRRLNSNFIRNFAYVLYAMVFARLLFLDVPANFDIAPSCRETMTEYWREMVNRLWTFGVSIASMIGGFLMERKGLRRIEGAAIVMENDMPELAARNVAAKAFFWVSVFFMFLFVHQEINTMFGYWEPFRLPVLTALWCSMAAYFLWRYEAGGRADAVMLYAGCVLAAVAVAKIFALDLASWEINEKLIYEMEYGLPCVAARLLDFGVAIGLFAALWHMLRRDVKGGRLASAFGYGSLLLLLIYSTLEMNSMLCCALPRFRPAGISILWAAFAAAFVSGGIWKELLALRCAGLTLFGVVAVKIFFFDLSHLDIIYRVIVFFVVGALLLLGSFLYVRSSGKFLRAPASEKRGEIEE